MTKDQAKEILKVRKDPWYFFKHHVKTLDEQEGDTRPFPRWKYLRDLVNRLHKGLTHPGQSDTLDMKSSQMMWTWTVAAYGVWEAMYHGRSILYVSKREGDAKEIKVRAQFVYDQLDEYLQAKLTAQNELRMVFGDANGRLLFMPTSENIGRTFSMFRVVGDEVPKWPFGLQGGMYSSLRRMCRNMNLGGTPDRPDDLFQRLWNDPAVGYVKTLIHYSNRPDRSASGWAEKERKRLGFTNDDWERDYECNPKVSAGLVFKDFRQDIHVIQHDPLDLDGWIFGIDFGYNVPSVILAIGFDSDGRAYIMDEFYAPGFLTREIILESEALQITWDARDAEMWADSASPERIREYIESGANIHPSNKDFDLGMREISGRLRIQGDGLPRLFVHCRCVNTIEEFVRYAWPKETSMNSAPRRPMKKNDHAMDALRYALCQGQEKTRLSWI